LLLLFPGSNLRAARGEERHIDDEKNAFVCLCVCVFVLYDCLRVRICVVFVVFSIFRFIL